MILSSLLITAGFGVFNGLKANHVLGGELSYINIGGTKYKFTLSIFRNCNECEFNTGNCADINPLDIYASPDVLNYAKKLAVIPLTKTSKKDVTPLCKSVTSSCNNGTFPFGIEQLNYEGYVDFDTISKDYCKFEIGIRINSRKDVYSLSGGNGDVFYNYTRINICGGIQNSSPVFQSPVYYQLIENQSFTYNILAADPDGDSLSYKLVNAQKGWNSSIAYASGYSGTKPLSTYCPNNCDLDRTANPIEGVGIDARSGWMGFTPITSGEEGFLVVEVTEWRKKNGSYQVVGVSRRDAQISVTSQTNYLPRISTSAIEYTACSGQDFMFDLSVIDPSYGGIKDSVNVKIYSDLPDFVYSVVKGSAKNQFDAFYTAPVKTGQIRYAPYFVTFVSQDDHCPMNGYYYQTVEIKVTGIPQNTGVIEFDKCNQINVYNNKSSGNYDYSWFLFKDNKLIDSRNTASGQFQVPAPGKYYVRHQITDKATGCEMEYLDSIVVPYFSLLVSDINWPEMVCPGTEVDLKADFTGGTAPFIYSWSGNGNDTHKNYTVDRDTLVFLKIVDQHGCELNVQQTVKIFSTAIITTADTALCLPTKSYPLDLGNRLIVEPKSDLINYRYNGSVGFLNSIGGQTYFEALTSGTAIIGFDFTDVNGCEYTGNFSIKIVNPLPTGIVVPDETICSNDAAVDLDMATKCLLSSGNWTCVEVPNAVAGGKLFPKYAGAGYWHLAYLKDLDGCLIRDTTTIAIHKAPDVSITALKKQIYCETDAEVKLSASPSGGFWSNSLQQNWFNRFSPASLIAENQNRISYYYRFTDPDFGCTASDTLELQVNSAPVVSTSSELILCEGQEIKLEPNPENVIKLQLGGDFGVLDVKRIGGDFILKTGDIDEDRQSKLFWTVTALPGCKDSVIEFTLNTRARPEIEMTATPQSGCVPLSANLQINSLNNKIPISSYLWSDGVMWKSDESQKTVNLNKSGVFAFYGKALNGECEGNVSVSYIRASEAPVTDFIIDPSGAVVSSDYSFAEFYDKTSSTQPYTLLWEFEKAIPATSTKSRVGVDFPKDSGVYKIRLTATNVSGCSSESLKYIRVRPSLKLLAPTVFTPDNKGPLANEVFKVSMDSVVSFHMTMRNRWGEIVFATENLHEGWDGTTKGTAVPAGVYVWEIEANTIYGIYVRKAGTVLLVR